MDNKIIYYYHKRITETDYDRGTIQPRIIVKDKLQRKAVAKLTHKWFLTPETMQALTAMGYEFRQYINRWA